VRVYSIAFGREGLFSKEGREKGGGREKGRKEKLGVLFSSAAPDIGEVMMLEIIMMKGKRKELRFFLPRTARKEEGGVLPSDLLSSSAQWDIDAPKRRKKKRGGKRGKENRKLSFFLIFTASEGLKRPSSRQRRGKEKKENSLSSLSRVFCMLINFAKSFAGKEGKGKGGALLHLYFLSTAGRSCRISER